MTRTEYDRQFAATQDNTEGYTDGELAEINAAAFEAIAIYDVTDPTTKSSADHAIDHAIGRVETARHNADLAAAHEHAALLFACDRADARTARTS